MLATTPLDDNIIASRCPSQESPIAEIEDVKFVKRLFWPHVCTMSFCPCETACFGKDLGNDNQQRQLLVAMG